MTQYAAPLRDMRFVLYDVLGAEALYARLPGCEAATRDLIDAVLEEGAKFTGQVLGPLNKSGDAEGCKLEAGAVRTPKGFKQAYEQFVANGWSGLVGPVAYGGQGLPESVGGPVKEIIAS